MIFHARDYAAALHELLQALPHSAPAAAAEDIRLRFWQALLNRLKQTDARHAGLKAHNRNTLVASAGVTGFKLAYVIREHGTGVSSSSTANCGRPPNRLRRAVRRARRDRHRLRAAPDLAAVGRAQAQPRGRPVYQGGYFDTEDWESIQTALIEAMGALEGALEGKLRKGFRSTRGLQDGS